MTIRVGRLLVAVAVAGILIVSELTAVLAGVVKQIHQRSL